MGKKTKIIILLMFIAIIIIAALFLSGAFTKKDNNNHNNNGNNDIVENKNENYSAMVDISVVKAIIICANASGSWHVNSYST